MSAQNKIVIEKCEFKTSYFNSSVNFWDTGAVGLLTNLVFVSGQSERSKDFDG